MLAKKTPFLADWRSSATNKAPLKSISLVEGGIRDSTIRTKNETDDTSEAGTKRHRGDENTYKYESRGFSSMSFVRKSVGRSHSPAGIRTPNVTHASIPRRTMAIASEVMTPPISFGCLTHRCEELSG